ncbi:hypothetical protein SLEP1_g4235 [Rubroshorea leprosula]|uniref:Uncharacterized protein n=1 Tax=Rubroshorea leprosula TaxID=152421 RepID=A0AAV5HU13_9ROSI|nr:hypothetical protein SLEP1_g4235 [Rubroshorea leprosula]
MESMALNSSPLSLRPFSTTTVSSRHRRSAISTKIFAAKKEARGRDSGGRIVDESMIVLRKRIHEMKMIERNYEPPADWMEWEKRFYTSYDSMICEIMGVLQSQLMNTRPSVALGVMALIALSLPISATVVFSQLTEMAKGIWTGIDAVF